MPKIEIKPIQMPKVNWWPFAKAEAPADEEKPPMPSPSGPYRPSKPDSDNPWVGGFSQSHPDFPYPKRDLTSLPMLDNMANIDKLDRQMKVWWPEFSWLTNPDLPDDQEVDVDGNLVVDYNPDGTIKPRKPNRCYQRFGHDISRIGYTKEGRVFSIICPQACAWIESPFFNLNINIEVKVTGNRGWVDEDAGELAADIGVVGKIWFSAYGNPPFVNWLFQHYQDSNIPLPLSKEFCVDILTSNFENTTPYFPLNVGETTRFRIPEFARHTNEATPKSDKDGEKRAHARCAGVGNLDARSGDMRLWTLDDPRLQKLKKPATQESIDIANNFNRHLVEIFNIASGNMLAPGNVLSWNVWFEEPTVVDRDEWQNHAEVWRDSLAVSHLFPEGPETKQHFYNGQVYRPTIADAFRAHRKFLAAAKESGEKAKMEKQEVDKLLKVGKSKDSKWFTPQWSKLQWPKWADVFGKGNGKDDAIECQFDELVQELESSEAGVEMADFIPSHQQEQDEWVKIAQDNIHAVDDNGTRHDQTGNVTTVDGSSD